jgi:tRNA A37 threonylcarbamoyltransferase TsaD
VDCGCAPVSGTDATTLEVWPGDIRVIAAASGPGIVAQLEFTALRAERGAVGG